MPRRRPGAGRFLTSSRRCSGPGAIDGGRAGRLPRRSSMRPSCGEPIASRTVIVRARCRVRSARHARRAVGSPLARGHRVPERLAGPSRLARPSVFHGRRPRRCACRGPRRPQVASAASPSVRAGEVAGPTSRRSGGSPHTRSRLRASASARRSRAVACLPCSLAAEAGCEGRRESKGRHRRESSGGFPMSATSVRPRYVRRALVMCGNAGRLSRLLARCSDAAEEEAEGRIQPVNATPLIRLAVQRRLRWVAGSRMSC